MGNLNYLWWTDAEEDGWRCREHPSWHQALQGVCPACLRQRLLSLCPDCATVKPCACAAAGWSSQSSSSTSSSLSILLSLDPAAPSGGREASSIGAVGRVGSLIECEPAFRRSRSSALGLRRNRSGEQPPADSKRVGNRVWRLPSWLAIKPTTKSKSKTESAAAVQGGAALNGAYTDDDDGEEKVMPAASKLHRSRSVGFGAFAFQQKHRPLPACIVPTPPRLSTGSEGTTISSETRQKGWNRWYLSSSTKAFGDHRRAGQLQLQLEGRWSSSRGPLFGQAKGGAS